MTYLYEGGDIVGGGTCPVERSWGECIEGFAGLRFANDVVTTCETAIDVRTIPAWRPSPDDQRKRQVAAELRQEVEAHWKGVQEIVIRDFNMEDSQITMFLKLPDGNYYQGCGFHAEVRPHCESWHLFRQAPLSKIRQWIFARPYPLK